MDEHERREMQALCDQFRELMAHEVDQQLFDNEARVRIGEAIGKAVRKGRSDYACCSPSQ